MTDYPSAHDGPSSLYAPVDAFSSKPLETTATVQILAGDSTISVQSTFGGAPRHTESSPSTTS